MFEGKVIPGYRHQPGFHCASSAIRNVLAFHGIRISEPAVIGLGRGPGFSYHVIDHRPSHLVHMRNLDLEDNFFRTVGIAFRWRETENAAEATAHAKASVDRGLPVLIQTDIIHLPYFNTDQHFPGHAVVICGYSEDKQEFYVSDTLHPEALAVSIPDMERARTSVFPPFALRNRAFVLEDPSAFRVDEAVVRGALRRWAQENLNGIPGFPWPYGVRSLEDLIGDLSNWKEAADWQWSARFTYQIIERRGTGGAGFRTLYRQFLEESEERYPGLREYRLSQDLAGIEALYHDMATGFRAVSDGKDPDFSPVRPVLERLLERENALYRKIVASL